MKIRINNLLPLMVMLILALLTLWLRQAAEQGNGATRSADSREPNAIVENFTLVKLDPAGAVYYSLSAKRMLVFSANDSTVLEVPRLERRDEEGVVITVTAGRGRLTANSEEAYFYDNVLFDRDPPGSQPNLQVRTDFLHVIPGRDLARTDRHVTIQEGNSTLSGVGMEIDRAKRQLTLSSQVKGTYDAAKRN